MATTPTLRPLGVGEILDAGIKLYLRHWKPLMICVAGIVVPVQVLSLLVFASIDTTTNRAAGEVDWPAIAAISSLSFAQLLSTLLATGASLKAVTDAWLGSEPDPRRSLRFGLRRLPGLLWLVIVLMVCLGLAFFALIVPAIWLGVAWALAVPAMLFERVGAFGAMRRSFGLTRGRWWPTFGALIAMGLLSLVVALVVQIIPSGIATAVADDSDLANVIAETVGGTISSLITTPFTAAVVTLLYFDLRVRKEGFDLQLLAEGIGTTRDPDAPLPEPLAREPRGKQWSPTPPGDEPTYGGGYASPSPAAPEPAGDHGLRSGDPPRGEEDAGEPEPRRERDPGRADWLPPEAPRGPGGL